MSTSVPARRSGSPRPTLAKLQEAPQTAGFPSGGEYNPGETNADKRFAIQPGAGSDRPSSLVKEVEDEYF